MATYKSPLTTVGKSADTLFERFSNHNNLQGVLDSLPVEQRAQVGDVQFTDDSLKITTPQVGDIEFSVVERVRPSKIVFGTKSSPVPLTMEMHINPLTPDSSSVQTQIDVEIPAMLRPLIGPQLQKAADKFGELIAGLSH